MAEGKFRKSADSTLSSCCSDQRRNLVLGHDMSCGRLLLVSQ